MGCLKALAMVLVLPVVGWFAGGWADDWINPQPWEAAAVGDTAPVTLAAGTYGLFESAAYQSNARLVDPRGGDVVEQPPAREAVQTRSDRVFRLSTTVTVPAGEYVLGSDPSPFSNPQALVALGADPYTAAQRHTAYSGLGALLLLIGGITLAVRTRR